LTFDVVFGVFAAAMIAIAVLAVRWAVGRDRIARESAAHAATARDSEASSGSNGAADA
jgi:hypothetical protein